MKPKYYISFIIGALVLVLVSSSFTFIIGPTLRKVTLIYDSNIKEVEESSYKNRKEVEDTCRSMISQYKSDVEIYNMYKNSDNVNQRNYADAARIRAVTTANQYNEYILKNSFVWKANVPDDIYEKLETNIE